MQKPALLRAIYTELRATLGEQVASGELLKVAHAILRAYQLGDSKNENERLSAGRSLFTLPVDEAMRDGGWRVLEFEKSLAPLEDRGNDITTKLRPIIEKYLGPEWQHHSPQTDRL